MNELQIAPSLSHSLHIFPAAMGGVLARSSRLALFWSTEMIALGCIGAINLLSMTCAPLIPLSLLGVFHHAVALNYSRQ